MLLIITCVCGIVCCSNIIIWQHSEIFFYKKVKCSVNSIIMFSIILILFRDLNCTKKDIRKMSSPYIGTRYSAFYCILQYGIPRT